MWQLMCKNRIGKRFLFNDFWAHYSDLSRRVVTQTDGFFKGNPFKMPIPQASGLGNMGVSKNRGWVYQWSGPAGPRRYGPCGGARVEPAEPAGPRQYGEPAGARRAREPAEPAGPAGFNLFRPTSFKVLCRNPACSRKTTAYYNPILFHATAKYYSILVYTTLYYNRTRPY